MKTIIVNIPEKKEALFLSLLKELKFKSRVLSKEDEEELAMVKWINEGMKSEDITEESVFKQMRKHGVKI